MRDDAPGSPPGWARTRDRLAFGPVKGNLGLSNSAWIASWVILSLFAPGCTSGRLDYHSTPPRAAFEAIEPGVTTRSEVLHRLGPPEELRRLSNFDRSLDTSPQERRVLEGGDLFGRDAYTYARSERRIERFAIPPFGPTLFAIDGRGSREERWRIEFDEADRVRSVSHVDEIGARP